MHCVLYVVMQLRAHHQHAEQWSSHHASCFWFRPCSHCVWHHTIPNMQKSQSVTMLHLQTPVRHAGSAPGS